jgi:cysteine desulfuration protein SufE
MYNLPDHLSKIIDHFKLLDDRQDKIDALISIANRFEDVPESIATRPYPESARIPGCESEAYLFIEKRSDGLLNYHFAIENPQGITAKALAMILQDSLSGEKFEKIINVPDDVIFDLFGKGLSMGKSLGLINMLRMVKSHAKCQL